jgi:hypothetical protein
VPQSAAPRTAATRVERDLVELQVTVGGGATVSKAAAAATEGSSGEPTMGDPARKSFWPGKEVLLAG